MRPVTRRFRVHWGRCERCGRRHQGRHPLQTSDALGAASVQIGPNALATAAHMNKELGVTYGKVGVFFETRFSFTAARSTWCRANMRLAEKARPTFNAMVLAVRHTMVVYADETGWRIGGRMAWLWVFTTKLVTVYVIRRSRGFDVVEEILTAEYAGTLGRDGWAPYRKLLRCAHQTCLGHLLVRCRNMLDVAVAVKLQKMKLAKAAKIVRDGVAETFSYYSFPEEHWARIRTNNGLERIMKEIRRRTRVVGSFPDGKSALMLAAARLRHIAGTKWGECRYLDMTKLKSKQLAKTA